MALQESEIMTGLASALSVVLGWFGITLHKRVSKLEDINSEIAVIKARQQYTDTALENLRKDMNQKLTDVVRDMKTNFHEHISFTKSQFDSQARLLEQQTRMLEGLYSAVGARRRVKDDGLPRDVVYRDHYPDEAD